MFFGNFCHHYHHLMITIIVIISTIIIIGTFWRPKKEDQVARMGEFATDGFPYQRREHDWRWRWLGMHWAPISRQLPLWRRMWKGIEQEISTCKTHERIPPQLRRVLQTGAIREECADYKELEEQARMPDVRVWSVEFGKKSPLETVAAGARWDRPPQTDICWKMPLEKRLFRPWPTNERWPWTPDNRCWRWVVCQMVSGASWQILFGWTITYFWCLG